MLAGAMVGNASRADVIYPTTDQMVGERFAVFSSGGEQIGVLEAGAVHATSDPMVCELEAAGGMDAMSGRTSTAAGNHNLTPSVLGE